MSKHPSAIISKPAAEHISLRTYVTGFVSSVVLTATAYILVVNHALTRVTLISVVIGLVLVQFLVQMVFFLHLGRETRPRWKLVVFLFMLVVILILVFGSLWIMDNLNYRMTPQQINNYMNSQAGL